MKFPNGYLNFHDSLPRDFELPNQEHEYESTPFLIAACLFFGIGIAYWLIGNFKIGLKKVLTQIHVYLTLGITWFVLILIFYSFYFPNKFMSLLNNSTSEIVMDIFCLLIIIAQVLFLINLAFGIREKTPAANSRLS